MAREKAIRRKDIIISACLAVAMLAAAASLRIMLVSPAVSAAHKAREAVAEAKRSLLGVSEKDRELLRLRAHNTGLRAKLAQFDKRIPDKRDRHVLFAQVLKLAESNELRILQTKPGEPVLLGQGFHGFPYEMELQGGYHQIAKFMSRIESHEKFIRITRGSMSGSGDDVVRARVLACLYGSGSAPEGENAEADGTRAGEARGQRP